MDVNLWFARDEQLNDIVTVVNANKENTYTCPICESKVIPKALESAKVSPHFAHVDVSKCSAESMIHFWYKHKFIDIGDTFTIKTDKEYTYTCADFTVEKEYKLSNGIYRPDLIVITECGEEIIFEMANTNKKNVEDYIDRWIELDKIIVEVDIKTLQGDKKIFNALYYKGKCFNFNKRETNRYSLYLDIKEYQKKASNLSKIKDLEWFWKELNNKTVDDSVLFEIFDEFSQHEKKIFIKSSHSLVKGFISDFSENKRNEIINKYKNLEGFIDFYRTNRSMSIYNEGNEYSAITKTSLNLHYSSKSEIFEKIDRCYKSAYGTYKKHEIFNRVNNCKNLSLAVKELDYYLKNKLDENYSFEISESKYYLHKPKITLKYKRLVLFEMRISNLLLDSSDKDLIYEYLIKKVSRHISIKFNKYKVEEFKRYITKVNKFLKQSTQFENTYFELNQPKASKVKLKLKSDKNRTIYSLNLSRLSNQILINLVFNMFKYNELKCSICSNSIHMSIKFIENDFVPPKRCSTCKTKK